MASTYSALKIQLMATGENSGTWGTVTNDNLGVALEEAIVGSADVTFSSADVDLTLTDTNAAQIGRNLRLNLVGSVATTQVLYFSTDLNIEKVYIINNGLTQNITVRNKIAGTPSGSSVVVPAGKTMWVYNTGTNVVDAVTHLTSLTLGSALPIASGGTGSTSTTYANLQSNVSGVLPVANGGTGSASTTYANLQSNVSGVLPVANGGTGSATATFSGANITSLNASSISSGTLNNARTTASSSNGASTIVARGASGEFAAGTITATFSGSGASITSLNASSISSGTIANARTTATNANGASTIVARDASGNFIAHDIQFDSFGVGTAASGTTGEIRATNNVTAFYTSDRKFKTNIQSIPNALEKVVAIGGKTFDWTEDYINDHGGEDGYFLQKNDFGVIAQDVQAVFPIAVRAKPDGTLAVDYEKLCALAFAAIIELKTQIDVLKKG
jgi:hypothetical protein